MHFKKSILTIILTGISFISCNNKTEKSDSVSSKESQSKVKREISAENLQKASFTIEGMTCAIGCAKTIEKELNGLDGVQNTTVDFDKKLATISFDKSILKPENITKVVESTGDGKTYKVSNIKLEAL